MSVTVSSYWCPYCEKISSSRRCSRCSNKLLKRTGYYAEGTAEKYSEKEKVKASITNKLQDQHDGRLKKVDTRVASFIEKCSDTKKKAAEKYDGSAIGSDKK